jgi:hypothetical protein
MTIPKSLVRASTIMAVLSYAGMLIGPIVVVLVFIYPDRTHWLDIRMSHVGELTGAVPLSDRMSALAFELIPILIASWGLFALAKLFRLFAKGKIFASENLRALGRVAMAIFWYVVFGFLAQAPVTYFMSHHAAPGHREISLGFGSDDVEMLFLAGATFVIARVMAEARRMADENAAFV